LSGRQSRIRLSFNPCFAGVARFWPAGFHVKAA
jgi:hypothetical protein